MQQVGGVDGIRGGWVLVTAALDRRVPSSVEVVTSIAHVVERLDSGALTAAAIDIPIGLPDTGSRPCDLQARKLIGRRRNSVFPAPLRAVLGAPTYEEACRRSKALSGKSLSQQAFALLPKIEEVDQIMTPQRQETLVEVHPEVCFTVVAEGRPMQFHKSGSAGRAERLALLRRIFSDIDQDTGMRVPAARPDDVLDACIAAWSAMRWVRREHVQLGGDLDSWGLRMEIVA